MFRIRAAGPGDLPFMRQWAPYSAWETMSQDEQRAADVRFVAAQAAELVGSLSANPGQSLALVAELAGQAVGYLLGAIQPDSTTGEPQGYFYDLFVLPALRRRGIGRALQQTAEQIFTGAGLRKVKMWSGLHNQAAIRMAERSGFKAEGILGLKQW